MKINTDTVVQKQTATPHKRIGKEVLILNLRDGNYFVINEIGFFIWNLIDGRKSIEKIASRISSQFDVSKTKALRDMTAFVKQLDKIKLISHFSSPSA